MPSASRPCAVKGEVAKLLTQLVADAGGVAAADSELPQSSLEEPLFLKWWNFEDVFFSKQS